MHARKENLDTVPQLNTTTTTPDYKGGIHTDPTINPATLNYKGGMETPQNMLLTLSWANTAGNPKR